VSRRTLETDPVISYIIRRFLRVIVLLLVASLVTFVIFYLLPSADPAVLRAGPHPTPQLVATIRHKLGLNEAWYVQYFDYMKALLLHFDFGYSYQSHIAVGTRIFNRLPATISLTVGAAILWLLTGTTVGTVAAMRSRSAIDRFVTRGALLAISVPVFWLGMVSLYLFASDAGKLPIFPGAGSYVPLTHDPVKWFTSLVLPWCVLAAGLSAMNARVLRFALNETLSESYIGTARAKGLSERRVILRHALRAAVLPIVTLTALDIGILVGGAIVTETVFDIPGIGRLLYDSIQNGDLPMIQGIVLVGAWLTLVAGLVVDISRAFIDPRVRYR
jgi:peptide/nickel transport system permease protein